MSKKRAAIDIMRLKSSIMPYEMEEIHSYIMGEIYGEFLSVYIDQIIDSNTWLKNAKRDIYPINEQVLPEIHKLFLSMLEAFRIPRDMVNLCWTRDESQYTYASVSPTLDKPSLIVISYKIINFDKSTLKFILGHELGHILLSEMKLKRIIEVYIDKLGNLSQIPVAARSLIIYLFRLEELFADRIGLLAVGDLDNALSALSEVVTGIRIDPNVCLHGLDDRLSEAVDSELGIGKVHPSYAVRMAALKIFYESKTNTRILKNRHVANDTSLTKDYQVILDKIRITKMHPKNTYALDFIVAYGYVILKNSGLEKSRYAMNRLYSILSKRHYWPHRYLQEFIARHRHAFFNKNLKFEEILGAIGLNISILTKEIEDNKMHADILVDDIMGVALITSRQEDIVSAGKAIELLGIPQGKILEAIAGKLKDDFKPPFFVY